MLESEEIKAKMIHLAKFSIVVAFSIVVGLLCALGIVRFAETQELQRPLSQVLILGIFLMLAYKAGWLDMASKAWVAREKKMIPAQRATRIVGLCVLGIGFGLLMRLGIQGGILVPLKIISPAIYLEESRDLVELWQRSPEFSLSRLALFALGATREEIMYRFVILGAMMRIFGPLRAVLFSSLIFAAVHFNPITFISGIIFACVFLIFRSLLLLSVMHTTANSWHTLVAKYNLVPESVEPTDILNSAYGIVLISSTVALIIVAFLILLVHLRASSNSELGNLAVQESRGIDLRRRTL